MPQIFVGAMFIAWALALTGYGAVLFALFRSAGLPDAQPPVSRLTLLGSMGLVLVSVVGTIGNFFVPLGPVFAAIVLLIGLLVFVRLRGQVMEAFARPDWLLVGLFLLSCAVLALLDCDCMDVGIYHIQAVKWLQQRSLIWGLANVNPFLGYNFSWFTVSALVQPPRPIAGGLFFLANPLLLFFFGVPLVLMVRARRLRDLSLSSMFLLSMVIPLGRVSWRRFLFSPSPDLPSLLLVFLVLYLMIRGLEDVREVRACFVLQLVFACYAVTVKLSAAPLLAAPLLFALVVRFRAPDGARVALRVPGAVQALLVAIVLPWLLRGLALSGGLFYPSSLLFFPDLPWAASRKVQSLVIGILDEWTRRRADPALSGGDSWIVPWLRAFIQNESLLILVGVVGILLLAGGLWRRPVEDRLKILFPPLLVVLGGVAFWFVTAPDPRLGYGYLFAAVSLVLLAGVLQMRLLGWPALGRRKRAALCLAARAILLAGALTGVVVIANPQVVSAMIISGGIAPGYRATALETAVLRHCALLLSLGCLGLLLPGFWGYFRAGQKWRTALLAGLIGVHVGGVLLLYRQEVLDLQNVPRPSVVEKRSADGEVIYTGLCWDAPLPCTPIFNPEVELRPLLRQASEKEEE